MIVIYDSRKNLEPRRLVGLSRPPMLESHDLDEYRGDHPTGHALVPRVQHVDHDSFQQQGADQEGGLSRNACGLQLSDPRSVGSDRASPASSLVSSSPDKGAVRDAGLLYNIALAMVAVQMKW